MDFTQKTGQMGDRDKSHTAPPRLIDAFRLL
jgi:hypothetical protein